MAAKGSFVRLSLDVHSRNATLIVIMGVVLLLMVKYLMGLWGDSYQRIFYILMNMESIK